MNFFAKNLRFLRNSHRLSQEAFAKAVQLNRGNIASYEKGLAEPNSIKLLRIARFFKVPLEAMIEEELEHNGTNYSPDSSQTEKIRITKEELPLLRQEAERLNRLMDGLKEFHLLRVVDEELNPQHVRSLQVDYERLMETSTKMQQLLSKLVDAYL